MSKPHDGKLVELTGTPEDTSETNTIIGLLKRIAEALEAP